jgi:hypothetical protein
LIGNTDMHFGNLSLILDSLVRPNAPSFTLAPVYDMLPMIWRPGEFQDELGYSNFEIPPTTLWAGQSWLDAQGMAQEFWSALAACQEVSHDLRHVAARQLAAMS